jgi:sRNA-binding carbon storage regulator CsrA
MPAEISQLTIDVRPGQHLLLDGRRIVVELLDKSGKLARLRVTAPRDVKIEREEGDQPRAMRDEMIA